MSRQAALFQCLLKFIKEDDFTSIDHMLKWEYQKKRLFSMMNVDGHTVIHVACLEGRLKCVDILMKHGGCAQIINSAGWTPLHAAAFGGNIEVARYLLNECTANPLAVDDTNRTASELTSDTDILALLKRHSAKYIQRKDSDLILSQKCATLERRRSANRSLSYPVEKGMTRVRSLVVTQAEAHNIRRRFISEGTEIDETIQPYANKSSSNPHLNVPNEASSTCNVGCPLPSSSSLAACASKDSLPHEKNDIRLKFEELRRKISSFSTVSPSLPRRKCSSKERGNKEMKNRDSGVFEEELETDNENIKSSSKKDYSNSEHSK